jgi:hypothetical protein
MATEAEVKKWLSTQKYTADQEITPFQRLRSKYLPPRGIKTWGEWYDQYNITPLAKEKEAPSSNRKKEIRRIENDIDKAFQDAETYQVDMNFSTPGSAEYNKAKENRDKAQAELDRLRSERNLILAREDDINTAKKIREEEEKRQRNADAGKPTGSSDKKLSDLKGRQNTVRQSIRNLEEASKVEAPQTTPSFGPPEVRGGQPVAGTGGGVTTPITGATTPSQTPTVKPPSTAGKVTGGTTGGTVGDTGKAGDKGKGKGKGKEDFQAVLATAESLYGAIDEVFKSDEDLKALLRRAVGAIDDPDDNFSVDRFISELSNTAWFKSNAGPIRQRGFFKRQYDALQQQIKTDDPNYQSRLEELDKTSEYGRGLANTIQKVKEEARTIGRQIDDTTARVIATNLYNYANELDDVKIRNAVLGAGKFTVGGITTGEAGVNKQTLLTVARANGLDLDKNFGEATINTWLDRIAQGESIETIKNLIRQTAKTTWQVDDRVGALLDQGVDLQTVYSPFRKEMATILELPEDEITIDQLSKKGLFGGQKPMNLYDFRRSLRQDDRWQYTEGARTEMAALTENLLRDFGFVG